MKTALPTVADKVKSAASAVTSEVKKTDVTGTPEIKSKYPSLADKVKSAASAAVSETQKAAPAPPAAPANPFSAFTTKPKLLSRPARRM